MSVYRSEGNVVVVEGRTPLVVDDSGRREVWVSCVLALFPAGDDALYGVGGFVASVLDEIRV